MAPYHYGRRGLLPCLFLLLTLSAIGQETLIHGRVRHWNGNDWLGQASVLLVTSDSTMLTCVRTQKDGRFSIQRAAKDSVLILIITHPAADPYIRNLVVGTGPVDLGTLQMSPPVEAMAAVVVTSTEIRPHLKGDTLEFNTRNIRLNQNANAEDLLKGLPGVTVDQNGNIYVHGQKVDHLLIDGEDFFSGQSRIATKSLTADMIAKVQLFNKKSDRATFTGVDDGSQERTLNLQLKNERKGGYFGNIAYGGNDQGFYNTGGMIASFKDKRQIALLGLADNTGPASVNSAGLAEGGLAAAGPPADPMGASAGVGIPEIASAGAHYADRWGDDAQHAVGNYQYGHVITRPWTSSVSIQNLVDTAYLQKQKSSSYNQGTQQTFNGQYDVNLDSLHTTLISAAGNIGAGNNQLYGVDSSGFNQTLVNSSQRSIRSSVDNKSFIANIFFRIQSAKNKGRSLSIATDMNSSSSKADGYLYQSNRFYSSNGSISGTDTVDQRKVLDNSAAGWNGMLFFSQHLKGNAQLDAHAGYSVTDSRNHQSVYSRGGGHYNTLIDSLSGDYHLKLAAPGGGLGFQDRVGKTAF